MTFQLICTAILALIIGLLALFAGYRLFLLLLPIWGFFAGFAIGAQATVLLFGGGFLATVTSWIVGFVVGLIFAVLSYLIYIVGVALLSAAFGYFLAAGVTRGHRLPWPCHGPGPAPRGRGVSQSPHCLESA